MRILQNAQPVIFTDTFAEWTVKFNDLILEISDTEFSTSDDTVDLESNQNISGFKSFNNTTSFTAGFNVTDGNSIISGDNLTLNSQTINFTTSANNGNVNFIGSNGINLLSSSTNFGFNLGFSAADIPSNLILQYQGVGTFTIDDSITLSLASSKLQVGNVVWNIISTNPNSNSILKWNANDDTISWQNFNDLATELTPLVGDSLLEDNNFIQSIIEETTTALSSDSTTLAVELIPVGSTIDIDATAVAGWPANNIDLRFPGWLLLDGRTITVSQNSDYAELIKLIANDQNATSATLSNSTSGSPVNVKIIKYKKDPITSFGLDDGNGISFTHAGQLVGDISLTSGISTISLKVENSDFSFNNGNLTLASNVARRTTNGSLQSSTVPTANNDLTNKVYVDTSISTLNSSFSNLNALSQGSTIALGENVDGFSYVDGFFNLTLVDRDGGGRSWSDNDFGNGLLYDESFKSLSPITNNIVNYKKSYTTPWTHYFVDNDDIIFAHGENSWGAIAQSNRGVIGDNRTYYSLTSLDSPYNVSRVRNALPAFLPHRDFWPANATTVDYISGRFLNLTLKTKDGFDNAFIGGNPTSGLVRYFDSNNRPYTRGYLMSIGYNDNGQFGNGNTTGSSESTGPLVWGPNGSNNNNFLGRSLWLNFGILESERNNVTNLLTNNRSQIQRRFNWFKPNAVIAGGLALTEQDALASWRTATALGSSVNFNQFDWFIKRAFRTNEAHYVIIGKPGTELLNEVWCAGNNGGGAFGVGDTSTTNSDFAPILNSAITQTSGSYSLVGGGTSGGVFRRTNNQSHNFSNFERLNIGTNSYVILTGDTNNANILTQFRLFTTITSAVNAFISGGIGSSISSTTLSTSTLTYRSKFLGVYDLHASSARIDITTNILFLKKVETQDTSILTIDALSESQILTNSVWSVGKNIDGIAAIGSTTDVLSPTQTIYSSVLPSKIVKVFSSNTIAISFALDNNGNLYSSGRQAWGLSDTGSLTDINLTQWTRTNISNTHRILNFFFIDFRRERSNVLYPPRIYVIAESRSGSNPTGVLFAGGRNERNSLGTAEFTGYTPRYVQIVFPEDPRNIVNMNGVMWQSIALVKNPNQNVGRVYSVGWDENRYFSTRDLDYRNFRNVDRFIL